MTTSTASKPVSHRSYGQEQPAGKNRESLYMQVTNRIIAELEGRLPWVQPWDFAKVATGLPRNAGTGRGYSGINILLLWAAVIERGYGTQGWLTYRQAEALGGHVRKGLHALRRVGGMLSCDPCAHHRDGKGYRGGVMRWSCPPRSATPNRGGQTKKG